MESDEGDPIDVAASVGASTGGLQGHPRASPSLNRRDAWAPAGLTEQAAKAAWSITGRDTEAAGKLAGWPVEVCPSLPGRDEEAADGLATRGQERLSLEGRDVEALVNPVGSNVAPAQPDWLLPG
jgi:hypothetical protein